MDRCLDVTGPAEAPDRKQSAWCGRTEYCTVHSQKEGEYEPGERDLDLGMDKEGN